ncbi:uncharacterized protein LOC120174332 [Hibiscus syriacus]|uniref:uncharacterized protein LOC120174332 n=1 Tax=Hibiscus syriacus TaxID=106335 RepID=UPI001921FE3A|nr:uncharacterized protein LOC120174332 [Hibiscus syriacus]
MKPSEASSADLSTDPRLQKKQRRRDEDPPNLFAMARDGATSLMECDDSSPAISYKDDVTKSTAAQPDSKTVDLEDDDIELLEEDITLGSSNDNGCRGRFACIAVSLNLHRPLVSKLLINGCLQIIEYESLPTIYFHCGIYGHHKYICPQLPAQRDVQPMTEIPPRQPQTTENSVLDEAFGPWMLVERKKRNSRNVNYVKQLVHDSSPIIEKSNPVFKAIPNNQENRSKSRVIEMESTMPSLVSPLNPKISSLIEPKSNPPDKNKSNDKAPTNPKKAPAVPYAPKKQTHLGGKPAKLHALIKNPMQGSRNTTNGASSSNLPRLNSAENLDPNKHHAVKLINEDNPHIPTKALVPPATSKSPDAMME